MNKNVLHKLVTLDSEVVTKQLQDLAAKQFETIKQSKSNDEIIQELNNLEVYCHRTPNECLEIVIYLLQMHPLPSIEREIKGYGKLKGADYDEVVDKVIKILDGIQDSLQEEVFKISLELSISNSEKIKNKALEFLKEIVSYNFYEMRHIKYEPQQVALKCINNLSDEEKDKYFEAIVAVLSELLEPEVEGSMMTNENTMQIQMGSLGNDAEVREIRQSVIKILTELYSLEGEIPRKAKIISALSNVSRVSLRGSTKEFEGLLVENIDEVLKFYISIIPKADFTIIRGIEHTLPWIKRKFGDQIKSFEEVKKAIDKVEGYRDFALLTGEGSMDEQYDRLSWDEAKKKVNEEMTNLIDKLAKDDIEKCRNLVESIIIASNYNVDSNQLAQFREFLRRIGKQYPNMGFELLNSKLCENEYFLAELLNGLLESSPDEIKSQMYKWIKNSIHLIACVLSFYRIENLDTELLSEVLNKADTNEEVLNKLAFVVKSSFNKDSKNFMDVKDLYVKIIKVLTKFKNTWWVREIYFDDKCVLNYFDEKDWNVVIDNLLFIPSVEYHAEEVCKAMITKQPELFLEFLKNRIEYSKSLSFVDNKYRALPFDFEDLHEEIQKNRKVFVPEFLIWLGRKDIAAYEIGHILSEIFSLEELEEFLLLEKDFTIKKNAIWRLLSAYQGHIPMNSDFVKLFIIKSNEKEQKELMSLMAVPGGVVTGEFGFAENMKSKLKELETFEFKDERLKDFIKIYRGYLKKWIRDEEKKTREEIILRRERFRRTRL